MVERIEFKLNHEFTRLDVDPERPLLWVLRSDLGLTGPKYGCGIGVCGACAVLVDNESVRSCQSSIGAVDGKEVVTIEGLSRNGALHPLQEAFVKHGALQCGYCTPGMIVGAYSLLRKLPNPTEAEIIAGMDDHLCRCGAHNRIIAAIQDAAKQIRA